jgi:hypothetical protein
MEFEERLVADELAGEARVELPEELPEEPGKIGEGEPELEPENPKETKPKEAVSKKVATGVAAATAGALLFINGFGDHLNAEGNPKCTRDPIGCVLKPMCDTIEDFGVPIGSLCDIIKYVGPALAGYVAYSAGGLLAIPFSDGGAKFAIKAASGATGGLLYYEYAQGNL